MPANLLKALNYTSVEEAALDIMFLSARSKYVEFHQEVKHFEEKYGMNFVTFQRMVEARVNEEDFREEEDLMAWKFAQEGADYWRHKSEELEHAAVDLVRQYQELIQAVEVDISDLRPESVETRWISTSGPAGVNCVRTCSEKFAAWSRLCERRCSVFGSNESTHYR